MKVTLVPSPADPSEAQAEPGKRARTKAANREAILASARQVFARMGYEAASVRDIIRETGLAAGTFYNYFRSKEDIFTALTEELVSQFSPRLNAVRAIAPDFPTYVFLAFRTYFEFALEFDSPTGDDEASLRMDTPGQKLLFEEIRGDIVQAHRRGEIPQTDVGYFTAACVGIAREVGERILSMPDPDPTEAAEFCARFVLASFRR